jgi:hypothetical protein
MPVVLERGEPSLAMNSSCATGSWPACWLNMPKWGAYRSRNFRARRPAPAGAGAAADGAATPTAPSAPSIGPGRDAADERAAVHRPVPLVPPPAHASFHVRCSFVCPGIATVGTAIGPNATLGGVRFCAR